MICGSRLLFNIKKNYYVSTLVVVDLYFVPSPLHIPTFTKTFGPWISSPPYRNETL